MIDGKWVLKKHLLRLISLKDALVKMATPNMILNHSFSYPETESMSLAVLYFFRSETRNPIRAMEGC